MKKNDGWMNALFALLLIVVPVLVGFYFLLPDWTGRYVISYGAMWGVAIGFIAYVVLISYILIKVKLLTLDSIAFNIPVTIVMVGIFVSPYLPIWARGLIVLTLIMSALPANMLVTRIKEEIVYKNKKNVT
ncbi:MAG: hypothetical protein KAG04_00620 [Mycoplasmataceae bacterium]|nr:hypothetical protein [Mycoplasmataceae bacterium]